MPFDFFIKILFAIGNKIPLASISAVALNLYFNGSRGDTAAAVNAARQAEAH